MFTTTVALLACLPVASLGTVVNVDFIVEFIVSLPTDYTFVVTDHKSDLLHKQQARHLMKKASAANKTLNVVNFSGVHFKSNLERYKAERGMCQQSCANTHIVLLEDQQRQQLLQNLPNNAFSSQNVVLLLDQNNTVSEDKVYFPINSRVFKFAETREFGHINIDEVYQIAENSPTVALQFGTWDNNLNILNINKTPIYERRKNLQGHVFRAQTLNFPPFMEVDMDLLRNVSRSNGTLTSASIGGIVGKIWRQLEKVLNFTTDFRLPAEEHWGVLECQNTTIAGTDGSSDDAGCR
jgi:hypothetical protein